MKKQILTIASVAAAATMGLYAASDRLDIIDAAGKIFSVMVDDITAITFGPDDSGDGFSTVNIDTTDGKKTHRIADAEEIFMTPVDKRAHDIFIANGENSKIVLLDWRNNTDVYGTAQIDPDKPADWRGAWAGGVVHFHDKADKGYTSTYAVTGEYTQKVYSDTPGFVFVSTKDDNLLGVECLAFDMPFEPVTISSASTELETYKDKPFVGTYTGVDLTPGATRIAHKAAKVLSMEFKYNTTYVIKTTDSHAFDVLDLYTWNEADNSFAYVPYEGEKQNEIDVEIKTGAVGKFLGNDFMATTFHKILDDKPENNVKYFAAKGNYDLTVAAADEYSHRVLVQAAPATGGTARWFFYDYDAPYPNEITLQFSTGNNIGEVSTAFAFSGEEKIFKYEYTGAGSSPVFTFRGAEYGTYTGAAGNLLLDGFGRCTLGTDEGTYTLDGGLATVTFGSETRIFVTDRDAKTYTEMTADKWDGQSNYTCENATGAYAGDKQRTDCNLNIRIDEDFAGNTAVGTAAVRFTVPRGGGFSPSDIIATSGKYIYNAASKTLIITNIYMGTSATTSTRRNLVLNISDDKLSMWIDSANEDRVYGTGRDGSYVLTGKVNTLTAPKPAPSLAPKYVGAPTVTLMGNAAPTTTTLEINAAAGTAHLTVVAMGSTIGDITASYTVEGNVLTLTDVTSYKEPASPFMPPSETEKINVPFTIESDGTLKSTAKIGLYSMQLGLYGGLDLSTGTFAVP